MLPGRTSSNNSTSTTDSQQTLHNAPLSPSTTHNETLLDTSTEWQKYFQDQYVLTHTDPTSTSTSQVGPRLCRRTHIYLTRPRTTQNVLFTCLHGAGSSGMSFARFAQSVSRLMPEAGVLAIDLRSHGSIASKVDDGDGADGESTGRNGRHHDHEHVGSTIDGYCTDVRLTVAQVMAMLGVDEKNWPPIVLVGHSLGGAIATRLAHRGLAVDFEDAAAQTISQTRTYMQPRMTDPRVMGLIVLDVVEGSAIEALAHMKTYLAQRPTSFATVDEAVDWHLRSRTIRDAESARVSVPRLLFYDTDERIYTWRTDLGGTSPWWGEWFVGMSKSFLESRVAKALVLAGTDRLDRELLVGQMQGKFQLTVIPEAGHFIQEDVPDKLAELAVEFFRRNDRSSMVLPPKVSELLAQGKKI